MERIRRELFDINNMLTTCSLQIESVKEILTLLVSFDEGAEIMQRAVCDPVILGCQLLLDKASDQINDANDKVSGIFNQIRNQEEALLKDPGNAEA